jgi:hypothetical protein
MSTITLGGIFGLDYNEGVWTPVVADAASGGNEASTSSSYGHYTKIGNRVTITGVINNIDTTGQTGGNDVFITGLPYKAASLTGIFVFTGSAPRITQCTFSGEYVTPHMFDDTDYVRFHETVSANNGDFLTISDLTSGTSDINFQLSYIA